MAAEKLEHGEEEPALSSMTLSSLEASLAGEIATLKQHLDYQFQVQTQQLSHLLREAPRDAPRMRMDSGQSLGNASATSSAFAKKLSEKGGAIAAFPSENSLQGIGSQALSKFGGFGRQISTQSARSRRNTFVRTEMLKQHIKAKQGAAESSVSDLVAKLESEEISSWRKVLRGVVLSPYFNLAIIALIIINAALLGIEIDIAFQVGEEDIPTWYATVNKIIVSVFVAEIVLKMVVLGCREFWTGQDYLWNLFDVFIIGLSVVEAFLDSLAQLLSVDVGRFKGSASVRILRTLRLAQAVRGLRVTRIFRHFSALRALLVSIMSTMGSLMWTLLLLLILFYVFSVIFTQLVMDHCRFETVKIKKDPNAIPECPEELQLYWSNVIGSMHTLFSAITGGIDWHEAYAPLTDVSPGAVVLMDLYIVIGILAILNVITGVFVNQAIESAGADKEIASLKQAHKRMAQVSQLTEVFQEFEGADGLLNINDLETALVSERLSAFMESLGISTDDVWTLFMLIDNDGSGFVDLSEFVNGCMQLRGPAQSLQLAKMSYENKLTRHRIKDLMESFEDLKATLLSEGHPQRVGTKMVSSEC